MPLLLEVVGLHSGSMGPNARCALSDGELKIGRDPDNDWVLPQTYVSRRQAVVRCVNGMHFLEQLGSCPITLNDGARPLERNRVARLSPGDRILIDDIEIRVLEADEAPATDTHGPSAASLVGLPDDPIEPLGGASVDPGAVVDPLELLGGHARDSRHAPAPGPRVADFGSVLDEAMTPRPAAAKLAPAPAPLSDDWFSNAPAPRPAPVVAPVRRPPPAPAPAPPSVAPVRPAPPPSPPARAAAAHAPPQAASTAGRATLEELLRGAGIDPGQTALSPEVARQLGEVLRIVVEGTMQVLQARNDIRKEFRLPTTQVARKDNNPLKFSADVSDALHKLLVQRSSAYLDTVSSFEDAFDDIRVHQLVMLESLRAAFDHMLKEFDPEVLQAHFTRQGGRSSVLGLGGKPKLWESYSARYAELLADRDFAFRRLFGEEFGRAYEQNLERQRRMIKASKRGGAV